MDILTIAPMLVMFVAFYFLMIRPQMTKAKKEKTFQESLKVGTRVVTTSGIHGRIAAIADDGVVVETMSGKIKFEKEYDGKFASDNIINENLKKDFESLANKIKEMIF